MKMRLLSYLLLLLASSAYASSTINYQELFVAPATDISIYYLTLLFGSVSNVLVGGSNMVVGQMFYIFNTGIITFTAMLIFYTMTLSVVNTAQDGNAMGQKVSTWIVLRIVAGMSLLVPTYSGYSAIQILVMWSVVQGVGFADSIWEQALNTMEAYGGTVVVPVNQGMTISGGSGDGGSTSQWTDLQKLTSGSSVNNMGMASNIFQAGVCAMALYNQCMENNNNDATACPRGNFGFFRTSSSGATTSTWSFGQAANTGTNGYGAQMVQVSTGSGSTTTQTCGTFTSNNNAYYAQALDNMVMAIGPMAMDYYSDAVTTCQNDSNKCDATTLVGATSSNNGGCAYNYYNDAYVCSPSQMIISGASTYYQISMAARMSDSDLSTGTSWMNSAKDAGWAMAGSYYYNMVGGGASGELSLSAMEVPTFVGGDVTISDTGKPYYTVYNNMINQNVTSNSPQGTTGSLPPVKWYANAAYYYIGQMQGSMVSTGTDENGVSYSNPQSVAYDQFTALMLSFLNVSNPFGSLTSTGKSAYFGYMPYGDFTKYPGYVWNMLSSNLASLAGIKLYPDTDSESLFPTGSEYLYHPPGINSGCNGLDSCSSSPYSGCFVQAVNSHCIYGPNESPATLNFSGLLGQASASAQSYLSDPLLSIANTGRFILKNSMNYWTAVISQTFSDSTDLAGAYMGANSATSILFSLTSWAYTMITTYDAGGAFALLSGSIQAIAQFFFQLDRAVMEAWLPFGTSLAMMFFGLGIMMGVYLPLIPFLLYLFGVISWLISVVEAMVAAPLVAMGVTHPEGHDLLGKAEQSVMLLLGVFIRPAAMVIGLILAITLNYIMVGFFNFGFIVTVNPILSSLESGQSFQLVIVAATLIVYVYILIEVINQCFSMIFQVPDKLLRWIGGPQEQSSAAQAMNQIKGGVSSSASQGAQGASSSAGSAANIQGQAPQMEKSKSSGSGGDNTEAK